MNPPNATPSASPAAAVRGPIFDAHLHIIDPAFPLQANQGYLPPPFTVADYQHAAGLALSVDHLGLEAAALPALLPLVERGARVKATGFSRVDFAPADTPRRIHAANPQALMFGTDLPSTRAPRPFAAADLALLAEALGEAALPAVLWQNARNFYRLERT